MLAKPAATAVSLSRSPLDGRIANALTAYAAYLRKMVWPSDLAVLYPHAFGHWSWLPVVTAGLVLAGLTALAVAMRRRRPALFVGLVVVLGTLVPVIGLLQFNWQAMADRYTYFPLIGIFVAPSPGASQNAGELRRRRAPWLAAGLGGVLTACLVLTWLQIAVWRDDVTLWRHALAVTRDNSGRNLNWDLSLQSRPKRGGGSATLQRSVQLDGADTPALQNLGLVLLDQGKAEGALNLFTQATAAAPKVGLYQNSKGLALARLGRMDEARRAFEEAIRLDPDLTEPYFNCAAA